MSPSPIPSNSVGSKFHYVDRLFEYQRLITQEVAVGKLILGKGSPVKIQSMTTTNTMDTKATVEEIMGLVDAGCELVRITTPNRRSSENLAKIKNELIQKNYDVPLVADVHFSPQAALTAAEIVEKVRINPGNFVDRKKFQTIHYTEPAYRDELKRIEDKFIPLLEVCKKNRTALRIGTNHGSLSDRIVNRFGDNPTGMVHSALEFLDICEKENFDQIVFSMKSSNTMVMVATYRLLVKTLKERGRVYPIHLGVTEAGDGEDGRIKSVVGIGSLLCDGIGDTIRVSLTEDSMKEIPVARKILDYFESCRYQGGSEIEGDPIYDPYEFKRYVSRVVSNLGGGSVPKVILGKRTLKTHRDVEDLGFQIVESTKKWVATDIASDLVALSSPSQLSRELPYVGVGTLLPYEQMLETQKEKNPEGTSPEISPVAPPTLHRPPKTYPLLDIRDLETVLDAGALEQFDHYFLTLRLSDQAQFHLITKQAIIVILTQTTHPALEARELILRLRAGNFDQPIFFKFNEELSKSIDLETRQVRLGAMVGVLLIDGLVDGLFLDQQSSDDLSILFSILQASRQRISRTEYISCPSCGRTLFDLQQVTAKVKEETNHLKGVKIAIMGCIVNGPGEMADADFGYVGSGPGKITLYKGKEPRVKNVPSEGAVAALVQLLKQEKVWREK